jgi:hypothetical protein
MDFSQFEGASQVSPLPKATLFIQTELTVISVTLCYIFRACHGVSIVLLLHSF